MNQNFFHHEALQIFFFQLHKLVLVKHFSGRTDKLPPMNSAITPMSRSIALCFFVASVLMIICPIMLFQKYISI